MSSYSTLPSKYFNRLQANRLQAQNSYIINNDKISFLYSLLLKNNTTFTENNLLKNNYEISIIIH